MESQGTCDEKKRGGRCALCGRAKNEDKTIKCNPFTCKDMYRKHTTVMHVIKKTVAPEVNT
jgi:hypothetical protein